MTLLCCAALVACEDTHLEEPDKSGVLVVDVAGRSSGEGYEGSVEVPPGDYDVRVGRCPEGEEIISAKKSPGHASGLKFDFVFTYVAKRTGVLYRVSNATEEPIRATFGLVCAPMAELKASEARANRLRRRKEKRAEVRISSSRLPGRGPGSSAGVLQCLREMRFKATDDGFTAGTGNVTVSGPGIAITDDQARIYVFISLFEDAATARRVSKVLGPGGGATLIGGTAVITTLNFPGKASRYEPPSSPTKLPRFNEIKACVVG